MVSKYVTALRKYIFKYLGKVMTLLRDFITDSYIDLFAEFLLKIFPGYLVIIRGVKISWPFSPKISRSQYLSNNYWFVLT